jgi:hypothetical protein
VLKIEIIKDKLPWFGFLLRTSIGIKGVIVITFEGVVVLKANIVVEAIFVVLDAVIAVKEVAEIVYVDVESIVVFNVVIVAVVVVIVVVTC